MAIKNFSEELLVREVEAASSEERLGIVSFDEQSIIGACRVWIYKHGTLGGSETLQMTIHDNDSWAMPVVSSNVVNVADFSEGDYWLGLVEFEFDRTTLQASSNYYCTITAENYTPSDTFYISYVFDWPLSLNAIGLSAERGAHMEFYRYK